MRIYGYKSTFAEGFEANFTDEIFRTKAVNTPLGRNLLEDLEMKKNTLEKIYGKSFQGRYGPNSKKLLKEERKKLVKGRGGWVTNIRFKDPDTLTNTSKVVIVGVSQGNERESAGATAKFKKLMEEAMREFWESGDSVTHERIMDSDPGIPVTQEILDEVRENTLNDLESTLSKEIDVLRRSWT